VSWIKLDDGFAQHPKLVAVGPEGLTLQVRAFCYAGRYLTDGFIPDAVAVSLASNLTESPEHWIDQMVKHKLWIVKDGGFQVHDYLTYNPSKIQVETARKLKSRGGKHSQEIQQSARYPQRVVESIPQSSLKQSPVPVPKRKKETLNPRPPFLASPDRAEKDFTPLSGLGEAVLNIMPKDLPS
jgi:hypothetical protein